MAVCSVCLKTIQSGERMEPDDQGGLSHSDCRHGRRVADPGDYCPRCSAPFDTRMGFKHCPRGCR